MHRPYGSDSVRSVRLDAASPLVLWSSYKVYDVIQVILFCSASLNIYCDLAVLDALLKDIRIARSLPVVSQTDSEWVLFPSDAK